MVTSISYSASVFIAGFVTYEAFQTFSFLQISKKMKNNGY